MKQEGGSSQPIREYSTEPHNNNRKEVRCDSTCNGYFRSCIYWRTTTRIVSRPMSVHFSSSTQRMEIVVHVIVRWPRVLFRSSRPSTSSIPKVTWIAWTFHIIIFSITAIARTTTRSIRWFFCKWRWYKVNVISFPVKYLYDTENLSAHNVENKAMVPTYQTIRCHISKDRNLNP